MGIYLSFLHLSSIQMAACEEGGNKKVIALRREAAWTQSIQGRSIPKVAGKPRFPDYFLEQWLGVVEPVHVSQKDTVTS